MDEDMIELYKIWPSKNRFYIWGKLITGPGTDRF